MIGITYEDFWINLKPYQVIEYIEGYKELKEVEIQQQYNLIHELGYYVWLANNNPKKFPNKPREIVKPKVSAVRVQSDEEQNRMIDLLLN